MMPTGVRDADSDILVTAVLDFLSEPDPTVRADIRRDLEQEIEAAGPVGLLNLKTRLVEDLGWAYYPSDPLARRIHHRLADRFLTAGSEVIGAGHLASLASGPVLIFANHLSYADANVVEVLLRRCGGAALAERLTAVAGPKIFSDRRRRFSSLCFGTIKVPQSTEVSSGEAVADARTVARAARESIRAAYERLAAGDALLLFGEGTRSRSGHLQPMLPGVARYLEGPAAVILPVALTGPEHLFPIDPPRLSPASVRMHVGAPIRPAPLLARARDRRVAVDAIGLAIAGLLPSSYRGVYADPDAYPEAAAALAAAR